MSKTLLPIWTLFFLALCGCDDQINKFDLEKDPLSGKIGGVEWEYSANGGRVDYSNFSNQATGKIFNDPNLTDPCLKILSNEAHLDVAFFTQRGNYTLGLIDSGEIKFVTPNGGAIYTATSGFIEIVEVNAFEIIGYISADFDEDNFVQGSFLVRICD